MRNFVKMLLVSALVAAWAASAAAADPVEESPGGLPAGPKIPASTVEPINAATRPEPPVASAPPTRPDVILPTQPEAVTQPVLRDMLPTTQPKVATQPEIATQPIQPEAATRPEVPCEEAGRPPVEATTRPEEAAEWAACEARADAAEKLLKAVGQLKVDPEKVLADLPFGSPRAEAALRAFAEAACSRGELRRLDDGSCEVAVEVDVAAALAARKHAEGRYGGAGGVAPSVLDAMAEVNADKKIRIVGAGRAREEFFDAPAVAVRGDAYDSLSKLTGEARTFWESRCTSAGRLEAVRAARQDALTRLAARIGGVRLAPDLTVAGLVKEFGLKDADLGRFLLGARETAVRYHLRRLVVEVDVDLPLRKVYMDLRARGRAKRAGADRLALLEELILKSDDEVLHETGLGVPQGSKVKSACPGFETFRAFVTSAPPWRSGKLTASAAVEDGEQARMLAGVDARVKLAEQVADLAAGEGETIGGMAEKREVFALALRVFLQSARETASTDETTTRPRDDATVEIDLKPLWNFILAGRAEAGGAEAASASKPENGGAGDGL